MLICSTVVLGLISPLSAISPHLSENSVSRINVHVPQIFPLLSLALGNFCLCGLFVVQVQLQQV